MLRQTDKMLPDAIHNWGCYFMSVLYHAEVRRKKMFQADEVLSVYKSAMATGIVGKEVYDKDGTLTDGCFVNDPVALFNLCGVPVKSIVKMDAKYKAQPGEYEILCYFRPAGATNKEHTHFVPGYNGTPAWDPIDNSNTVRFGYIKSKRIFK